MSQYVVLNFENVSVVRGGNKILDSLNWSVNADERWVILGPNGAGKTTLMQIAGLLEQPSSGVVRVLGKQIGRVDIFEIRPQLGFVSSAMVRRIPKQETVLNTVLTASYAVTGRWNEVYEEIDVRRAKRMLTEWRLTDFEERLFGTLSDGEQKRVQIARALMTDPEILLLDEPAASLDLGTREELLGLLGGFAQQSTSPAFVMVTHHVEEIPIGFTHVLLLREGRVIAAGPMNSTLSSENLSTTFGIPVSLTNINGRFTARAI